MTGSRLPDSFFDQMYAEHEDPWGFGTRWYEQRKYDITMAVLPRRRFASGFEPGCSLGILSARLAERCDLLLATDVSEPALRAAAARLSGSPHAEVARWALGDPWPARRFDLIVLSEVGYYLTGDALRAVLIEAAAALDPGGTLLAVHWRHPVEQYPQTGDQVHALLAVTPGLERTARYDDEDMLVETYARTPPAARSVASQEGLT